MGQALTIVFAGRASAHLDTEGIRSEYLSRDFLFGGI